MFVSISGYISVFGPQILCNRIKVRKKKKKKLFRAFGVLARVEHLAVIIKQLVMD